ncbi:MAG: hypothetical protein ABSB38_03300 [Dehalococcoidia bacterium]
MEQERGRTPHHGSSQIQNKKQVLSLPRTAREYNDKQGDVSDYSN